MANLKFHFSGQIPICFGLNQLNLRMSLCMTYVFVLTFAGYAPPSMAQTWLGGRGLGRGFSCWGMDSQGEIMILMGYKIVH
jgi:hypothetical protein